VLQPDHWAWCPQVGPQQALVSQVGPQKAGVDCPPSEVLFWRRPGGGNLRPLPIRCAPAALRHVGADKAWRHGVCGDLRDDRPPTRGRNLSNQRLGRISRKALG
jgi:hypothetical protein